MNNEDFHAFRTNPDIDFVSPPHNLHSLVVFSKKNLLHYLFCPFFQTLLGDGNHRLLSAAQAAKMAVVYTQYTSLYVLTNVVSYFY